jgi:hypothetical protein
MNDILKRTKTTIKRIQDNQIARFLANREFILNFLNGDGFPDS